MGKPLEERAETAISENQMSKGEEQYQACANMSPIEYEQVRKETAKGMDMRVSELDKEVKKLRGDSANTQGELIEFEDPVAWHEPVDGIKLLDGIAARINLHMAIPANSANAVALWVMHAHCFDVFTHSPRLVITAPEKECGKTVLLSHIVGNLVPKPMHADNITPAVFFRLAQSHKPTFLIDEVDSWLREDSQLPSALNGGFESHGGAWRCEGDNNDVRKFSTFAPTAMAGINLLGKLPPPIISRAIVVELQRSLPGEVSENYDQRIHRKDLHVLRHKIVRWKKDNVQQIRKTDPVLPDGVVNRQADKWRPLATIAEVVGGKWPGYVQAAILTDSETSTLSKSEQLLHDIRTVTSNHSVGNGIFTDTLITELCGTEDSLWATYNFREREDKRIRPRQLAALLKPYKIKSKDIRQNDLVRKGYRFDDLETAMTRYLPPLTSATTLQVNDSNGYSDSVSATKNPGVADRTTRKPNDTNGCSGVADSQGGARGQKSITVQVWEPKGNQAIGRRTI